MNFIRQLRLGSWFALSLFMLLELANTQKSSASTEQAGQYETQTQVSMTNTVSKIPGNGTTSKLDIKNSNEEAPKFLNRKYPKVPEPLDAVRKYAEAPGTGEAVFFFCPLFLLISSWYITKCLRKFLKSSADLLDLYPETVQFPQIQLYHLQQSKKEARLRRENRNTWAWLAKTYILFQNDPLVNLDVFRTTWSDFDLPKDVWRLVHIMMKVNSWFRCHNKMAQTTPKEHKENKDHRKAGRPEWSVFKK